MNETGLPSCMVPCFILKLTIAGPVILYGVLASWVLGVIYWAGRVMGVF